MIQAVDLKRFVSLCSDCSTRSGCSVCSTRSELVARYRLTSSSLDS